MDIITLILAKKYTDSTLSTVEGRNYVVVEELPVTGEAGIFYLVLSSEQNADYYDEYVYSDNTFKKLGVEHVITIDGSMSNSSNNPVQNKVITSALADKLDTSTYEQEKVVVTASGEASQTGTQIATLTIGENVYKVLPAVSGLTSNKKYRLECLNGVLSWVEVPSVETFTISSWTADNAISPFEYKATVIATRTIDNDTIVELINDNAILFATYNFSIGSVTGQNITIYVTSEPTSDVTLKIRLSN